MDALMSGVSITSHALCEHPSNALCEQKGGQGCYVTKCIRL